MVEFGVASASDTVWSEVYVPGFGANVGVATSIVYVAEPTALLASPDKVAIALSVSECDTVIGPVYWVDAGVGVAPLIV